MSNSSIFAEMYVSQTSQLVVQNTEYFDIFFSICADAGRVTLSDFPVACDITFSQSTACFGSGHPIIDTFYLGPPYTTFTFVAVSSKIWAFALEIYPGSNVSLSNIDTYSNLAIGMDVDTGDGITNYTLQLEPGDDPILAGLEDTRTVEFIGDNVTILAYMLWASDDTNINIIDGGEIGDVYATGSDDSTIKGRNLILQYGNIRVEGTCLVDVKNSVVYEATLVLTDGVMIFDQCEFDSSSDTTLTNGGYTFFVDIEDSEDDGIDSEPSTMYNSGYLFYIYGIMFDNGKIKGTINEDGGNTFDCSLKLYLYDSDNGGYSLQDEESVTSSVNDATLWDLTDDVMNENEDNDYKLVVVFDTGLRNVNVGEIEFSVSGKDVTTTMIGSSDIDNTDGDSDSESGVGKISCVVAIALVGLLGLGFLH